MEDTMVLIERSHHGDKKAREQLVEENMGLVWSIVKRFSGRGTDMEDLFQIGAIGVVKAVDRFDLSFGVRFSTYAVPMITGEIKRFLRDDGMIKVSRSIKEMAMRVKTVRESLCFSMGREPTLEEIAAAVGASKEEVAASIEAGAEVESLYKTINQNDENGLCLLDKIVDQDERQEKLLNHMVLEKLIGQLGEKEKEIIVRRYYHNQTQTQVANALDISQVQVSRLEKKILKQMREQF